MSSSVKSFSWRAENAVYPKGTAAVNHCSYTLLFLHAALQELKSQLIGSAPFVIVVRSSRLAVARRHDAGGLSLMGLDCNSPKTQRLVPRF